MEKQTPQELIDKYLLGKATPEEQATLESWYLTHTKSIKDALPEPDYARLENEMWPVIDKHTPQRRKQLRLWPQIAAAAVILITVGIGIYFTQNKHIETAPAYANDIAPGKNQATLTLANGNIIQLSDTKSGVVINANNLKYNDGSLVQDSSGSNTLESLKGNQENKSTKELLTATTPRGGTYQIVLPDGTKVWLNAATKISFPVQFSGSIRKVMLSGEAYFEVVKDKKHPFIVESTGQTVEVLGTHFNINAYADETAIKTTLLEGSVQVTSPKTVGHGQESMVLKPGEQAIVDDNFKVAQADVELEMAWKNGGFVFRGESLESILRKISRWYNVEIEYTSNASKEVSLVGYISRSRQISAVLRHLERTGKVKFKLEGRKVTVISN